jgi:hypothetical protein
VFQFEQMALLHRHEGEWQELREVRHASVDDDDLERRLLRGERLYRCTECDLGILAVPPESR